MNVVVTEHHEGVLHLLDVRLNVVFDGDAVVAKESSISLISESTRNFEDIHRDRRVVLAVDESSCFAFDRDVFVAWKQMFEDHIANFSRQEHERELLTTVRLSGGILVLKSRFSGCLAAEKGGKHKQFKGYLRSSETIKDALLCFCHLLSDACLDRVRHVLDEIRKHQVVYRFRDERGCRNRNAVRPGLEARTCWYSGGSW